MNESIKKIEKDINEVMLLKKTCIHQFDKAKSLLKGELTMTPNMEQALNLASIIEVQFGIMNVLFETLKEACSEKVMIELNGVTPRHIEMFEY